MPAIHFNGNNLKFRSDEHAYLDFVGLKTGAQGVRTFDTTVTGQHRCTGPIKHLIGRNHEQDPEHVIYRIRERVIFKDSTLVEISGPDIENTLLLKGRDEDDVEVQVRTEKGERAPETLVSHNVFDAAPGSYPQPQSSPPALYGETIQSPAWLSSSPPPGGLFQPLQQLVPVDWFGNCIRLFVSYVYGTGTPDYRTRSKRLIHDCRLINEVLNGAEPNEDVKRAFDAAAQAMKVACENPPRDQETIEEFFRAAETFIGASMLVLKITPTGGVDQGLERDINDALRRGETWSDIFGKLVHQLNVVAGSEDSGLSDPSAVPVVARDLIQEATVRSKATSNHSTVADASLEPNERPNWKIRVVLYKDDLQHPVDCKDYFFENPQDCRVSSLIRLATDPENAITELSNHMNFYVPEKGRHTHTDDGLELKHLAPELSLLDIPKPADLPGPTVWLVQCSKPYIIITIGTAKPVKSADRAYLIDGYVHQRLREPLGRHNSGTYNNRAARHVRTITQDDKLTWGELSAGDVILYSSDWLLLVE